MHSREPLIITPRMLPRSWGRADLGEWCKGAPRPALSVGEIWLAHPHNVFEHGAHFGSAISHAPEDILGDLGRAPPLVRMVQTDAVAEPIFSDAPIAMWLILEARPGAGISAGQIGRPRKRFACKPGDAFLVSDDQALEFSAGIVAIEVRTSFQPRNELKRLSTALRLPQDSRSARSTLLRDPGLSVELWTLPTESYLRPNGETCHVIVPLSDGVKINGAPLRRGVAALIPANARTTTLAGDGAKLLVAYPDLLPTEIWRHVAEDNDRTGEQGISEQKNESVRQPLKAQVR